MDEIELLKQASSIGDAAMWKIKYEWLKPGVREREIEAKVHEFMLERGCEIIYDIIVASGGNTSPYRRWATDKLIRQGDLVIVDINAVGPSGYFIDFVRCFKCGGAQGMKMTQKEIDLYREVYDSMYAGLEQLKPGNTTADVAQAFPEYDDDKYGTVTLQQFAHSIGITLVRRHVDVARVFAQISRGDQREHVLRHRNLRGTSGLAANLPPRGKRARQRQGSGGLHADGAHGRGHEALMPSLLVAVADSVFPNLDLARAVVSRAGAELRLASQPTPEGIVAAAKDADALLVTYAKINADMIREMKKCKIISRFGIGVDNVDFAAATARELSSPKCRTIASTKFPTTRWRLLLSLVRKIPFSSARAHAGRWEMPAVTPIHRLRGTVLGLVGFGQIPQLVAPKGESFGMRVVAYDPYVPQRRDGPGGSRASGIRRTGENFGLHFHSLAALARNASPVQHGGVSPR